MTTVLPHWDLTQLFPSLESAEFATSRDKLETDLTVLERHFEAHHIHSQNHDPSPLEATLAAFNAVGDRLNLHQSYLYALVSTDSTNAAASACDSELDGLFVRFQKLLTQLIGYAGNLPSPIQSDHSFFVQRAQTLAKHQMSAAEEQLAQELAPSAWIAWGKLHGNYGSQLMITVDLPEGAQVLPMSAIRNLAYDPVEEVRRSAFHAEIQGFKNAEVPMAACLNGVKGMVGLLCQKRGYKDALDEATFVNFLDEATRESMLQAANESFPAFRRYLQAKARMLGKTQLPFYDLFAPVGTESRSWSVEEAESFVHENFATFGIRMASMASRAFEERWVDYEPRSGKRDGAYCSSMKDDVSRILMNWKPSYKSVSTLAHELGHAYHNVCLSERPFLQREIPSTLAETASIFCETIVKNAALKNAEGAERLAILEATLSGACQVVVDISSRYLFEKSVFEGRAKRDLGPSELCQLMVEAQLQTYGDGLDKEFLHPYMWAAKPHYYSAGSFYNFPYMFGLLFSVGLYAIYEAEPTGFVERYDRLLSECGRADAATLAQTFGIEIRKPDFWRESLRTIEKDIDTFVAMAP